MTGAQHIVYIAKALVLNCVVRARVVEYMEYMHQVAWKPIDVSPVMDVALVSVDTVRVKVVGDAVIRRLS